MLVGTATLQFHALSCQCEGDIATPESEFLTLQLRHAPVAAHDIYGRPFCLPELGCLTPNQHVKAVLQKLVVK